jgi:hypothetical protein
MCLIHPEQQPVALALEVREALEVGHGRHEALHRCDGWDLVGDEIVVRQRHDRMVQSDHPADPPSPQPGRVDDVLGGDRSALRHDVPLATSAAFQGRDAVAQDDLHAPGPGRGRVGVDGAARIEIALVRIEERPVQPGWLDDRDHRGGLRRAQQHGALVALDAHQGELGLEPPGALRGARELEAARPFQPDVLTGLGLDRRVQLDRVPLEGRDPGVGIDRVEAARRVPGGTGGEAVALDQDDVRDPAHGEVVGHADTDDPAADDHDPVVALHRPILSAAGGRREPTAPIVTACPNHPITHRRARPGCAPAIRGACRA